MHDEYQSGCPPRRSTLPTGASKWHEKAVYHRIACSIVSTYPPSSNTLRNDLGKRKAQQDGDRCLGWMTGNLVANISRRTLLLASCSLAGVPERSYAQALAMIHIILLGDSVFDNAAYVDRNPDVVRQLGQMLPQGRKATLLARDGAVISEIGSQLRGLPSDATHLVISVGGNDALHESGVLESSALSVADALTKLTEIGDGFGRAYGSMLTEVSRVGLPTAVCTIYEPRFPEAPRRKLAATALTLLNDKITRQAFSRGLTLIDLRLICDEDADFANPIEPSARGGAKIAQAISKFAGGATPRSSVFTDQ